jgi:hypothetical protein
MVHMMLAILLLIVLTGLWWFVAWFLLPVDLAALTLPSLVSLHVAPPVLAVLALLIGRQAWQWNKARKKKARDDEQAAQEKTQRATEAAARETEMAQRRAFFDCRAAWLAAPEIPRWFMDILPQCQILEQDAGTLRGSGREAALSASLQQVFIAALSQCEAFAYLPLYLLPGHDRDDLGLIGKAWQETLAATIQNGEDAATPGCRLLPDSDEPLTDRILALFENDPAMPAMWLLGADSLLDDAPESSDGETGIKPGHCVAALILSRPNLVLTEADTVIKPDKPDPMTPYWEHDHRHKEASPMWERIPPALREQFLQGFPPFATLHRSRTLSFEGESGRMISMTRLLGGLIEKVLVDAALRDAPPHDGSEAKKPELLDLGNLFHNCVAGNNPVSRNRVMSITSALVDLECWMNLDMMGNVIDEHGDTGAACPALMLAEAAMFAALTQLPVMTAESVGADKLCIGMVRPAAV